MKCPEFENLLHSLVSGRLLDKTLQTRAHTHAESCSRCSTQLQHERVLAIGLRTLSAECREKQAPTRIENALLEAFRVHKESLHPSTGSKFSARFHKRSGTSRSFRARITRLSSRGWLIGAAASALLLAGIGFVHWLRSIQPEIIQAPSVRLSQNPIPSPSVHEVPAAPLTVSIQPTPVPKVEKGSYVKKNHNFNLHKNAEPNPASPSEEVIGGREIDSKFLPLMAASPLDPTESGHLIRMNLPRSTMGRFGFPINLERAEEPIKADVLIGEDGVARAIRFVYMAEKVPSSAR